MKEGSYLEIEHGMDVRGRGGEELGTVEEVLVDEGSGIFVGLVLKVGRMLGDAYLLHGEKVDRMHDRVVHADAIDADLEPYTRPKKVRAAREFTA